MLQAAIIVLAGWYVFSPVIHGDWLWDDHEIRDNPTLHQGLDGLGRIWVSPPTTDYYPVEATVLWLEWHLWRDDVAGYHLTNVCLHLLSAFLLWRLLKKLGVRFAWLAGLLFTVHPLAVESVAWISEIKNTLSLPLLLLAIIFWIDYENPKSEIRNSKYLLSLLYFVAAMLTKSSVVMFPVIILLHAWWRRGRIGWADLRGAAPFFAVALLLGLVTVHFQSARAIVDWRMPDAGFPTRLGGAGLAIAFYFWKCVFPWNPMPIYPGWEVSAASFVAFIPWLVIVGVCGGLFLCGMGFQPMSSREHGLEARATSISGFRFQVSSFGKNALFGLSWFLLFLIPVLGFLPMAYLHIAPVGDQLVYLPLVGIVSLAAAAISKFDIRNSKFGSVVIAALLAALAIESHRYAGIYVDQETMWTYNAEHNSRTSSVYSNLGLILNRDGEFEAAIGNYEKAIQLDPNDAEAEDELAGVLAAQNRMPEARPHYERAIALYEGALRSDPGLRGINDKLGLDLAKLGRMAEAADQFEQAARRNPDSYEIHTNLGLALLRLGRFSEAISHYEAAARLNPGSATIQTNLGYALVFAGRPSEAIAHYEQALQLDPNYPGAHNNLGYALAQLGRFSEARSQFDDALRLNSNDAEARSNLARLPPAQTGP